MTSGSWTGEEDARVASRSKRTPVGSARLCILYEVFGARTVVVVAVVLE